jgi:hypothetical protein
MLVVYLGYVVKVNLNTNISAQTLVNDKTCIFNDISLFRGQTCFNAKANQLSPLFAFYKVYRSWR